EMPMDRTADGIEGIKAVVTGAEKDLPVGHAWAGLDVAVCLKVPELFARRRFETVELAAPVFVKAFADVKAALCQARGGKDLEHCSVVVELPILMTGLRVQTVDRTISREAGAEHGCHVDPIGPHAWS